MYKVLLVGHGDFPQGLKTALDFIIGKQDSIDFQNLDEKHDHNYLEKSINNFLKLNEYAIIVADLTGGAPHKIGARAISNIGKKTHFIVSGINLSFLMELMIKIPNEKMKPIEVKENLEILLKNSTKFTKVMSF